MKFFLALTTLLFLLAGGAGIVAAPVKADSEKTIKAARAQIGVTIGYDPAYRKLNYPGGDVPLKTGVCSDVVVRAIRAAGTDLQKAVHEDMKANFSKYPKTWGLKAPDKNIDHRRVPNLMNFFARSGNELPASADKADYKAGDIVAWNLNAAGFLPHIGIVSDKKTKAGVPLVIHNIGAGTQEEDVLFQYKIIGHYRL